MKSICDNYFQNLENKASETKVNSTEKKYYFVKDSYKANITHQIIYKGLEIIKLNSNFDIFNENIDKDLKNSFVVRYLKKGQLIIKNKNNQKIVLNSNEVFISYSEEKETVFLTEHTNIEELIIIIDLKYFQIFSDDQEIQKFINFFLKNGKNELVINDLEERLLTIFNLIIRYNSKWEKKLYIFSKINELLGSLIRKFTKISLRHSFNEENKIELIKAYLEKNYMEPNILSNIHKKFYISRTDLSRQFREATNMGLHEYLKSIKMEKAYYLILNENKKVSEVSLLLGYQNYGYFSRIFFKYFGIYPNKLKNSDYKYEFLELVKDYQ
ncbi:helix-turn-helix domain-containing protein [Sebaldella termitidis]|uniref:AraC family transcriptional regulator n=1 Tax=Sebaldella termitidis TaxID=826 RepID=UPI003EBBB7D6